MDLEHGTMILHIQYVNELYFFVHLVKIINISIIKRIYEIL